MSWKLPKNFKLLTDRDIDKDTPVINISEMVADNLIEALLSESVKVQGGLWFSSKVERLIGDKTGYLVFVEEGENETAELG